MSSNDKRIVDIPGLIEYLGGSITRRHLYSLCQGRLIPHGKMGGKLIFYLDEIDAWLEANRRQVVEP